MRKEACLPEGVGGGEQEHAASRTGARRPDVFQVTRTYYWVLSLYSLAMSVTLGVKTLFLQSAGVSLFGVFLEGSAFTWGMALFEIPTGVVTDTLGRRTSVLWSLAIRASGTVGFLLVWAVARQPESLVVLLSFCAFTLWMGFGYTLYSGSLEAWLVDALHHVASSEESKQEEEKGQVYGQAQGRLEQQKEELRHVDMFCLDKTFARGATISGVLNFGGTLAGGLLAQTSLALPFLLRTILLMAVFLLALFHLREVGYKPRPFLLRQYPTEVKAILAQSLLYGWRIRSVRLLMVASLLQSVLMTWGYYAWQTYFLDLLGDDHAVWTIGVITSLIPLSRTVGSAAAEFVITFRVFKSRTGVLLVGSLLQAFMAIGVGVSSSYGAAVFFFLMTMVFMGMQGPVKQALIHNCIPSGQRATILSFQAMWIGVGSIVGQTVLGYVSELYSVGIGYVLGGLLSLLVLPILWALQHTLSPSQNLFNKSESRIALRRRQD
ncbi:MFS transporter, variant 2 [Balamuthia mandrillaris]